MSIHSETKVECDNFTKYAYLCIYRSLHCWCSRPLYEANYAYAFKKLLTECLLVPASTSEMGSNRTTSEHKKQVVFRIYARWLVYATDIAQMTIDIRQLLPTLAQKMYPV